MATLRLNAFDSRLTNGRVEAVNSLIQAAKPGPAATGPPGTWLPSFTLWRVSWPGCRLLRSSSSRGFPSRP